MPRLRRQDEVLDVYPRGLALSLLFALDQPNVLQLLEVAHGLVVTKAHLCHRVLQREVDEHAPAAIQPAVAG